MEVTETVLAAGRTLLTYVSRKLTAESGITMRVLRNVRLAWAWREGHPERAHGLDGGRRLAANGGSMPARSLLPVAGWLVVARVSGGVSARLHIRTKTERSRSRRC